VRIRAADDVDAAACRARLPDLFPTTGYPPQLIVAEVQGVGVVGAVGLVWAQEGFPLELAVDPPWRRRGVGGALVKAAIDRARGETFALRTASALIDGGAEAAFLQGLGFALARRFRCFETDAAEFSKAITRLLDRLKVAPRGSSDLRIAPLAEAPLSQVVDLVSTAFSAVPFSVARRLAPQAANGYDGQLSVVALEGERVVAAMLCTRSADTIDIDVNVVVPDRRGGGVNVAVLEAMARGGRQAGATRFTFSCEPHVRDTLNLARRAGAVETPSKIIMVRPL